MWGDLKLKDRLNELMELRCTQINTNCQWIQGLMGALALECSSKKKVY